MSRGRVEATKSWQTISIALGITEMRYISPVAYTEGPNGEGLGSGDRLDGKIESVGLTLHPVEVFCHEAHSNE